MKKFSYIAIAIAVLISIYSATRLDFSNLLQGDSLIALISIVGAMCVILLLLIFMTSKKIEKKIKNNSH